MKNLQPQKPLFSTLLALVIIAGSLFIFRSQLCKPAQAFCTPPAQTQSAPEQLANNYFVYSPDVLKQALATKKKVVLYFWAPWCVSCTSLDQDLQDKKAQIPDNVAILRVEYDKASELKKKYTVVTQHTFVLINSAEKPLATWVGGGIEELQKHI